MRLWSRHGDPTAAEQWRTQLADQAAVVRERVAPSLRTVGDLLRTWIAAGHDWKPSTWVNQRRPVRRLLVDPLAARPLSTLRPSTSRAVLQTWNAGGMSVSTAALNIRTLRAAAGWACDERRLAVHALAGMRGPGSSKARDPCPSCGT